MFRFLYIIAVVLLSVASNAQNCQHTGLSKDFDVITHANRFEREGADSLAVKVSIVKKDGYLMFTYSYGSGWFFEDSFMNCNNVRSYATGFNKNADVADNDYGDIIVADFNFDGKDDIALKKDSGGNGGPTYLYFVNTNEKFVSDIYLTNVMEFFPAVINTKKMEFITLVHANAYQLSKITYRLNKKGVWQKIKHELVPYD